MPKSKTTPPALTARSPAQRVVTPELLAASAESSLDLARRFHREWFAALMLACDCGMVLVLYDVVIGWPDPLALGAAHQLRTLRQAEVDGEFDDDRNDGEDDWADDEAEPDRRLLPLPARVVEAMQQSQEADRICNGLHVDLVVQQILPPASTEVLDLVGLLLVAERFLADVADFVRIGQGMVVDARPPEVLERQRWRAAWGWAVRAAVHVAEVEETEDDVLGLGVTVAARVLGLADGGDVLATRAVVEVLAGSGYEFSARGAHQLKGVAGAWDVAAVDRI